MKASTIRKLASTYDVPTLQAAADALIEEQQPLIEIDGEDEGEMLTHVNLAIRIRQHVDAGEDLRDAFRAVMGDVRELLTNEE